MSNVSGVSSGSSNVRERARVVGVPKRFWCGEEIVAEISKSDPNPCRRYFRCGYAASKKLMNDNHIFKWVDESLLEEVAKLTFLQEDMKETMKEQKLLLEKMQMELEKEIIERLEDVMEEFKCKMNKRMMLVLGGGFMILFGLIKLVG